MKVSNRTDLPKSIYAAAGAGELAYQRLRKLPEVAARTLRTAGHSADEWRRRLREQRAGGEFAARVRASAERGTELVRTRTATVRERAAARYQELVERGEHVLAERLAARGERQRPGGVEVEVGPVTRERPEPAEPEADGDRQPVGAG